jgi:hypothetical protein
MNKLIVLLLLVGMTQLGCVFLGGAATGVWPLALARKSMPSDRWIT